MSLGRLGIAKMHDALRWCETAMAICGDTATVIKDLKVKGSSIPLGQGTIIRNIGLVENDAEDIGGNSEKIKVWY